MACVTAVRQIKLQVNVSAPEQMMTVGARCAELGIAHGDVHDRGEFGIAMDVADPDGTVLRFVADPL